MVDKKLDRCVVKVLEMPLKPFEGRTKEQSAHAICTAALSGVKDGRKKRKPSEFNIFLGQCIKGKTGRIQDRFKDCAKLYKEKKAQGR